jgi:hypothetical protein
MQKTPQSAELNGTLNSILCSYLRRKIQNLKELSTHRQTYVGTTENGHRDTKNMFLLSLVSTGDKFQQGIRKITTKRDVICVIRR